MNEYKDFEDDMYRKFEEWTKVPIWTDRKIMDFRNGLWKDLLDIDKKLSIEEAKEKYLILVERKENNHSYLNKFANFL